MLLTGALDSTSAVAISLPATWNMVYENRISRIRRSCMRGGSSSKLFEPSRGTKGLWSVSMWKLFPMRNSANRRPKLMPEPPFQSGRIFVLCCWELLKHMLQVAIRCLFVAAEARHPTRMKMNPQRHEFQHLGHTALVPGVSSDPFWCCQRPVAVVAPRPTCFSSLTSLWEEEFFQPDGVGISQGDLSSPESVSPHHGLCHGFHSANLVWVCLYNLPQKLWLFEKSHLSLSVTPASCSRDSALCSLSSCSFCVAPQMSMSPIWHTTPSRLSRIRDIRFWKCSGADDIPKHRRL